MLQMKLAVAMFLQRYRFTGLEEEVPLEVGVTIRAARSVTCRLAPVGPLSADALSSA